MNVLKTVSIIGARPQFIKYITVSNFIQNHNNSLHSKSLKIDDILIHTGQHYDYRMSDVFFNELEIKEPDYNLEVGSGSHAWQTAEMMKKIEPVLNDEKPAVVMVYGDTNSTLAGALAASKLCIPVAHVEAGLRSFNRRMPEEINRVVTDHVSTLLFCPTETSLSNLKHEGIMDGVHLVGDVMYDLFLHNVKIAEKRSEILNQLKLSPKEYILATLHRAENTEPENFTKIINAFIELAGNGEKIVFPVHPRTRELLNTFNLNGNPDLHIIDPVSYYDMLMLEKEAKAILTDSGGVQKEAYFHKVSCLTLRNETEWMETVDSGWNHLCGADMERIVNTFSTIVNAPLKNTSKFYGNGNAAGQIVVRLLENI
jgi:UDP-N-acetylglucosamine 2-epimerase